MSKKEEKEAITIAKGGGFIDESSCGSTVNYYVNNTNDYQGARYNGSVQLTDCSRMITWHFDGNKNGIKKIDEAIRYLKEMRAALIKAEKLNAVLDKQEEDDKKKKKP